METQEQELDYRIQDFLKSKNIEHPFIQECVTEFIKRHVELYGDIIPVDELFRRLEENLDKITFAGRESASITTLGEYKGRIADNTDLNEILLYYNESELDLDEYDKNLFDIYTPADQQKLLKDLEARRAEIKSTLIHELTHAAYTIKGKNGNGEDHIFSKTIKDSFSGEYRQIGGNNNNVEAIVNYIASRIEGIKTKQEGPLLLWFPTYEAETQAIFMLAEKVDEKAIIQSAWESDEEKFKQAYITAIAQDRETGEKSYDAFQKGMKYLITIRKDKNITTAENIKKSYKILSEIQQILDGKALEVESSEVESSEFKHIHESFETFETFIPDQTDPFSFSQKVARFLLKHSSLMNIPFVKKFVDKQLKVLPSATSPSDPVSQREEFIKKLSKQANGRPYVITPPSFDEHTTPHTPNPRKSNGIIH